MSKPKKAPSNKQLTDEVIRLQGELDKAAQIINQERANHQQQIRNLAQRLQAFANKDRVWDAAVRTYAHNTVSPGEAITEAECLHDAWIARQEELAAQAAEKVKAESEAAEADQEAGE